MKLKGYNFNNKYTKMKLKVVQKERRQQKKYNEQ
jgi:hypothetical protein